jgi:hypothetical protein
MLPAIHYPLAIAIEESLQVVVGVAFVHLIPFKVRMDAHPFLGHTCSAKGVKGSVNMEWVRE